MHPGTHNTMAAAADVRIDWPLAVGTNYVIVVPEGVTEISEELFEGIFFKKGRTNYPQKAQVVAIELPDSLIEIPRRFFAYNETLRKVTIGSGVKRIHDQAFCGCTRLKTVIMRSGDKSLEIGTSAFSGCESLERVEFPDSLAVLESYAFHGCAKLLSVTISNHVNSIGLGAFGGCSSLKTVTINSNAAISDDCFMDCSSLTSVDFTLEKIPSLGSHAFQKCISLVVDPEWADRFTDVAKNTFEGVQPFPLWLAELDGTTYKVKNWKIPSLGGIEIFLRGIDFAKHVEKCANQQHPEALELGTWRLRNHDDPRGNTSKQLIKALLLFESGKWDGATDLTNVWTVDWAVGGESGDEGASGDEDESGGGQKINNADNVIDDPAKEGEDEATPGSKRGRNSNDDGGAAAKSSKPGLSFTDLAI